MPLYKSMTALLLLGLTYALPADQAETAIAPVEGAFETIGELQTAKLDEASGIQAGQAGVYHLHNDDGGAWLYTVDINGQYLGRLRILEAKNKDWEDITLVPADEEKWLMLADSGDNKASRKDIELYFVSLPEPQQWRGDVDLKHKTKLSYADGPRDVEAISWDPHSDMILLLSKRDKPPRLYGVSRELAISEKKVTAKFLTEVDGFRPPTRSDLLASPTRGLFVSQPTGMDISRDGRWAAVITYRSLYLFERGAAESWVEAFQKAPREYLGPPGLHDEAVTFDSDGVHVIVTTEKRPAPIHRLELPPLSD